MSKYFYEVFKTLELENRIASHFDDVMVDRVCATKSRSSVKVYITSNHLIPKKSVFRVEKLLGKQLFRKTDGDVRIYETFHLSDAYNPENLYDEYRESILVELERYGVVYKTLLENAEVSFGEDKTMLLTVEDSGFLKEKSKELSRILEKIFTERCGIPVNISFSFYKQDKENDPPEYEFYEYVTHPSDSDEAAGDADDMTYEDETIKTGGGSVKRKTGLTLGKRNKGIKKEFSRLDTKSPDVLYGSDFADEEMTPIENILQAEKNIIIHGQIINAEERVTKNGKYLICYDLTDFTDTIRFKLFIEEPELPLIRERLSKGGFIKIYGNADFDNFDNEMSLGYIKGIKTEKDFRVKRTDNAKEKRVELHCHTKMSELDGMADAKDIVKQAYSWGHKAVAITDHGVVSAFPEANHAWEDIWKEYKNKCKEEGKEPDRQSFFKVIYGVEGYLVDDSADIATNDKGQTLDEKYVVFDIETTGFSPVKNKIIEIGAVKVINGKITEYYSTFVNPHVPIPYEIVKLTSITDEMVKDAKSIEEILPEFMEFSEGAIMVAHNASFDMSFIKENCRRQGIERDFTYVDTMGIARVLLTDIKRHTLDSICKKLNIVLESHHRAVDDAGATAHMFVKFVEMLSKRDIHTLKELNALGRSSADIVKRLFPYHVIILAKNETGRVNLYRLISESHLNYFQGMPRMPKTLINKYREGLIIGSACERGELYRALLDDASDERLAEIVSFYDYLEIQPVGNNRFMIASPKVSRVNSEEDIIELNQRIVSLGEQFNKPVVATCDAHFINPEDEIYRKIIMAGRNMSSDSDNDVPLYYRTTDEMLEEFGYLGEKKAYEVVVANTQKIADMIESISPVRPDKCPPVIPHSDETLRKICYDKAHELYGEELPAVVADRLEKELNSIISNGFAVMYIIAQKLVWKSVEDGYLVGSRGSVGSSLVAFMAGITEVNSLAAHYRCPKCHYTDFDSEEIRAHVGNAGCDLPDKLCPVCGEKLIKDGFDIPFETFLGFKGDKEPDIDLNFSGEYQTKAHKYTEVIFGAGQTYRAGTIGTLADKTAYGYVKHYFEDRGIHKRSNEIDRLVQGCVGVRRTTGQHPGGIVVLPVGEDINSFTPVQHPPQDDSIITTHFEYHSIDHNLLKLDILGHDDPTMIRMLQDLTGIEPTKIPLDDKEVMSLFQNTDALGITPSDIDGTPTGSLGIPEFGTDFVIKMLMTTKPKTLSDLIRISGLGHGTDVWLGNAEKLIEDGTADLASCICCRDDIMIYLISKGVEPSLSFTIMESVRKGKGLKPEWEEEMTKNGVPDWYIWSCKKIKYMFPKAHAAAYVMMAWRIGYCKINYPLAYYAAYFSIRAKAFNYELMCQGPEILKGHMKEIRNKENPLPKEENLMKDMRIVQEMYARGFEFAPIDVYTAHPRNFQIVDGKIMPSLNTVEDVAEAAAEAIAQAAKDGPFLSKDDFRDRTRVSQKIVDRFSSLGLLGDVPESNQISIFDFV